MVAFAVLCAILSVLAMFLPGQLWLVSLGLGILAIGAGRQVWRCPQPSERRLVGALAALSGGTVVVLAVAKVGLTLLAIERVVSMLAT